MGGKRKKKHTQSCTKEKGKLDYVEKTTASEYFYIAFGLLGFFEEIVLVESFSSSFHQGQETTLEKKREWGKIVATKKKEKNCVSWWKDKQKRDSHICGVLRK